MSLEFLEQRDPLTEKIIGCAIEVHRQLGPGLLESTYESALAIELELRRLLDFGERSLLTLTQDCSKKVSNDSFSEPLRSLCLCGKHFRYHC